MTQQEAARLLLDRRRARTNLCSFKTYLKPEEKHPWFHLYAGERLTAFFKGETKRLIIEMPPGYAKSDWASRVGPSFAFGVNPDHKILSCSHGAELASNMNRDVQRIMDSEEYHEIFPHVRLGADNIRTKVGQPLRNSDMFDIVDTRGDKPRIRGFYKNSGVLGSITGRRFSLGIIDDYLKDFEEANSPVVRDKIWNWYVTTFYSRRLPNAGICICATRWHQEDLIGKLLKLAQENPRADQWEVVAFQHFVEEGDALPPYDPRKPGELLWPERYDWDDYESVRQMYTAFQYEGLYQQRPIAREGNVILRSWFPDNPFFEYTSTHRPVILYFDLGGSSQPTADRTVGTIDAQYRIAGDEYPRTMLLHQMSGQWDSPEREDKMEAYCLKVNELFPGILIMLENTFGLAKDIAPQIRNRLLSKGLNVQLDPAKISKFARAEPFLASARAGRVSLYSGDRFKDLGYANWRAEFLDEVSMLQQRDTPKGPEFFGGHDDRLDSAVGGFNKMTAPKQPDYFAMN